MSTEDKTEPLDPKEAMRQALERKKAHEQEGQARIDAERDKGGHAHGQVGGKRVFRRKSGG
ncbi:DUF5302 domain-containing protein [Tessaracoccus sp. OS52]|uniref:DUF5302 domain-containing protein n=1 Tax=Tessaracoccus sp. OS52 TaxID=2886691 RepID=UPI001D10C468|nr:DUF5302 domain-containing protein [Tessaracoccus sp. OS52]MCC2594582.1 DUF5302 domain-containing protein [Tessaracoccus sp. OS52]